MPISSDLTVFIKVQKQNTELSGALANQPQLNKTSSSHTTIPAKKTR